MKRSFLQNSARRMALLLAMLLLLGGTPVQAAGNTTDRKSQQASMESRVCPLLLPPGNSVTLSAEYLEMRLGLPAGEIAAITITSLPKQSGGRLMLDGRQGLLIGALFIIVVPLVVLVYGIVVWFRRRHL